MVYEYMGYGYNNMRIAASTMDLHGRDFIVLANYTKEALQYLIDYAIELKCNMQEDKEGMFDTIHTLDGALQLFAPMIATMKVNDRQMREAVHRDFSNATDVADFLVSKGLPF